MKKILIFTASMGSGHLTASQGIKDRLMSEDTEIEIIDVLEWTIFGKFSRWSFSFLGKYFLSFLEFIFNSLSKPVPTFLDRIFYRLWFRKKYLQSAFENVPDEVWTTFPVIPLYVEPYWNKTIHVQVTDYMTPHLFWIWGNNVCVHVLDEDSKQYVLHNSPKSIVEVGTFPFPQKTLDVSNYSIDQKNKIRISKGIEKDKPVFLFFFHHVLFGNEHALVEQFLASSKYKNYLGIIVAGSNVSFLKDLENDRIIIQSWIDDIQNYYAIASGVCGKCGGAFISEVVYFQLPICISGVLSGQERGNKAFLEKYYKNNLILF